MKKLFTSVLLTLNLMFAFAQMPTGVTAKVIDGKTYKPMPGAVVSIQNTNLKANFPFPSVISVKFVF